MVVQAGFWQLKPNPSSAPKPLYLHELQNVVPIYIYIWLNAIVSARLNMASTLVAMVHSFVIEIQLHQPSPTSSSHTSRFPARSSGVVRLLTTAGPRFHGTALYKHLHSLTECGHPFFQYPNDWKTAQIDYSRTLECRLALL